MTEPLWKVADVARFLSMSASWVYKEAEAGRLPCIRFGASLRFRPEQIRHFIEAQARRTAPAPVTPLDR